MADWRAADVPVNGFRMHYYRTGGQNPVVLLLHGLTDNAFTWERLARELAADYDLVLPDARGHGLSDAPTGGYSAADHASDAAALIRALGLGSPVVIGHSMGAAEAMALAAGYPELVRAAILEDPPLWAGQGRAEAERAAYAAEWRAEVVASRAKSVEELVALYRGQHPNWDDLDLYSCAEAERQVSLDALAFVTAPHPDWRETMRRIACPVLLLTADPELGAIVTPEIAAEAGTLMRQGHVVRIPGAGHGIRREQFEGYLGAVRAFLAEWARG